MFNINVYPVTEARKIYDQINETKKIYAELINEDICKQLSKKGCAEISIPRNPGSKFARQFIAKAGIDCYNVDVARNVMQEVADLYQNAGYTTEYFYTRCIIRFDNKN